MKKKIRAVNRRCQNGLESETVDTARGKTLAVGFGCHQRYRKPGDADPEEEDRKWSVIRKEEESRQRRLRRDEETNEERLYMVCVCIHVCLQKGNARRDKIIPPVFSSNVILRPSTMNKHAHVTE
jgi:hypothetical protein